MQVTILHNNHTTCSHPLQIERKVWPATVINIWLLLQRQLRTKELPNPTPNTSRAVPKDGQ